MPLTKDIMFSFDDSNSELLSKEDIDMFKQWMEIEPDRKINITGYSSTSYDPRLTPEQGAKYNQELSQKRANDVMNQLIKNGVDPDRILTVEGKGSTSNFGGNDESNQKVTLTFTYEKQDK